MKKYVYNEEIFTIKKEFVPGSISVTDKHGQTESIYISTDGLFNIFTHMHAISTIEEAVLEACRKIVEDRIDNASNRNAIAAVDAFLKVLPDVNK